MSVNKSIEMRHADIFDVDIYYSWVNDPEVRQNSFNKESIDYDTHIKWFTKKIKSKDSIMYFFTEEKIPIGQVRIDCLTDGDNIIDISVDFSYRKKGLGAKLLDLATADFKLKYPEKQIIAYIKIENIASIKQFIRSNFIMLKTLKVYDYECIKLKK
jgi:RimJ/RimL family protein N-acetyltransferase